MLLVLAGCVYPAPLPAADAPPTEGLVVQVPNPVTTEATHRLRSLLHGPLKRFEQGAGQQGGRFVLVCDFNPDGRRADCDDFGACHDLSSFLRSVAAGHRGVRTVAYVHGEVRRHSVLPALACNDLVFFPTGRLGQVARRARRSARSRAPPIACSPATASPWCWSARCSSRTWWWCGTATSTTTAEPDRRRVASRYPSWSSARRRTTRSTRRGRWG
ncbi:MAG: hypothetical protein U0736_13660 [Gemmataceae bacterium]